MPILRQISRKSRTSPEKKWTIPRWGGLVLESYAPDTFFSQMAETAIFTHHGLTDCVSVKDGKALIQERKKKYTAEQIAAVRRTCEQGAGAVRRKNESIVRAGRTGIEASAGTDKTAAI